MLCNTNLFEFPTDVQEQLLPVKKMWIDTNRQDNQILRCITLLLWLILLYGAAVNYILNNDEGRHSRNMLLNSSIHSDIGLILSVHLSDPSSGRSRLISKRESKTNKKVNTAPIGTTSAPKGNCISVGKFCTYPDNKATSYVSTDSYIGISKND